mgnify:CR=1 FL=1
MIIDINKTILIFFISILIYFVKKKIFSKHINLEKHQSFSTNILGNPIGGYVIFISIIFFSFFSNFLELFFLFCIFILGILSDTKFFNSPKYRLLIQILIISLYIILSNLQILSTRVDFFDELLKNNFINLIFTAFCILIVINGTNFIDGLNGLAIGYYSLVTTILLSSDLSIFFYFDTQILYNFLLIFLLLILANYFNLIYLGDSGSYLLGFLFSILLIKIYGLNPIISPYFIILLLWYPCFENLFSIIRKKRLNSSATEPDNNHLHQLIFIYFLKKFKFKSKQLANNLSSIVINSFHILIFLFATQYYNSSIIQITLIFLNISIYILLYFILLSFKSRLKN